MSLMTYVNIAKSKMAANLTNLPTTKSFLFNSNYYSFLTIACTNWIAKVDKNNGMDSTNLPLQSHLLEEGIFNFFRESSYPQVLCITRTCLLVSSWSAYLQDFHLCESFYVKWFILRFLTNLMISDVNVFCSCMVHGVLAQVYCTLTVTIDIILHLIQTKLFKKSL